MMAVDSDKEMRAENWRQLKSDEQLSVSEWNKILLRFTTKESMKAMTMSWNLSTLHSRTHIRHRGRFNLLLISHVTHRFAFPRYLITPKKTQNFERDTLHTYHPQNPHQTS